MSDISPIVASAYKNSNLFVAVEKSKFPYRYSVIISDEPGFFSRQKRFLFKKKAFDYVAEVTDEFAAKFWR